MSEEFDELVQRQMFSDMGAVIDRVIELEGHSRVAAHAEDPQGVDHFANLAYSIFMDVPMKLMPTVIMGLADATNRERDLIRALREDVRDASSALRAGLQDVANVPGVGSYTLGGLMTSLATFDEIVNRLEGYGESGDPES